MNRKTEIVNAIIESTKIGYDRGLGSCPSAWLMLKIQGGASGGFGGFHLGGPVMSMFVLGVLDALEVESWNDLPGTACRIESEGWGGKAALRIGHLLKEQWFDPRKMKEALEAKEQGDG